MSLTLTSGIVDKTKQVMVACVDFSEFTDASGKNEMYDEFENSFEDDIKRGKFVIFDEKESTVWICWYEEALM